MACRNINQYCVVEFTDESSVAVVHSSWIDRDNREKKVYCYWPSKNQEQRAKKGETPDFEAWTRYLVRVLNSYDSFEKAREKRNIAEALSTLETDPLEDSQTVQRKRKLPTRYHRSSDSEDDTGHFSSSVRTQQNDQPSPRAVLPKPPAFKKQLTLKTRSKNIGLHRSVGDETIDESPSHLTPKKVVKNNTPHLYQPAYRRYYQTPASTLHLSETQRDSPEQTARSPREGDGIVGLLTRMERQILQNQKMLQHLLTSQTRGSVIADFEDMLPEPIHAEEKWEDLLSSLSEEDYKNKMIMYLSVLGGNSLGDVIRRMCRKIATNKIWSLYSLKGRTNGKLSLQEVPIFRLLLKAAKKAYPRSTEAEVEFAIALFLRQAPFQNGGNKKDPRGNPSPSQ